MVQIVTGGSKFGLDDESDHQTDLIPGALRQTPIRMVPSMHLMPAEAW